MPGVTGRFSWSSSGRAVPQWVGRAGTLVLLLAGGLVVATMVLLAAVHVDDRYQVGPASGVWMGLAAAARAGVWYPPAFAHGFYGGTRYMPLPLLAELAGRAVAGEYLVSGKVLVLATNAALYLLLFVLARRRGATPAFALAIVGAVLATAAATTTLLGIRWDALATLLQVAALALVDRRGSRASAAGAGALCALALLTKISALWAPAAILVWLLRRSRTETVTFVVALVAVGAAGIGVLDALSSGRLVHQIHAFAFAGSLHSSYHESLRRIYQLGLRNQRADPLLALLGLAAVVVAVLRRRVQVYELALLFALPVIVVVMRDFGSYENHFLDIDVLAGIAVAGLVGSTRSGVIRIGAAALLLVGIAAASRYTVAPEARAAIRGDGSRYAVQPLPQLAARGTCVLFEDASIPILAGQRPVVLDAFILHRLQGSDPSAIDALVGRIDRRQLSAIVLGTPLSDRGWFATIDFGTRLADAMDAHYRLARTDGARNLYVYVPRRPPAVMPRCGPVPLRTW